jgi:hypothetical protein
VFFHSFISDITKPTHTNQKGEEKTRNRKKRESKQMQQRRKEFMAGKSIPPTRESTGN